MLQNYAYLIIYPIFVTILFMNRFLDYDENPLNTSCIECQYLHRPNPSEDIYICLRDLKEISHEIDENVKCKMFNFIQALWKPIYLKEYKNFI